MPEIAPSSAPARVHVYERESLGACRDEVLILAGRHFAETARFKSGGCSPDMAVYEKLEASGCLFLYTIREIAGDALIGYCTMIVRRHHHTNQVRGFEDLLYIVPERRGIGAGFVAWIDGQLAGEGVEVVQRACQTSHNHGKMYHYLGYDKTEETWSRALRGDTE